MFLNADTTTRARRRQLDMSANGDTPDLPEIIALIEQRDARDANREAAPLARQPDMIEVDTSDLTIHQVLERLIQLVAERVG